MPLGHTPGTGPGDTEIDSPAHAVLPQAPNPGEASALGVAGRGPRAAWELRDRDPWGEREGLTGPWVGQDDY